MNKKTKVIGLKVTDEVYQALNSYCAFKGYSKQFWLDNRLSEHFDLLVAVNNSKLTEGGHSDDD